MQPHRLIHDWNVQVRAFDYGAARVELFDQTLRDGLQAPSVQDPAPEDKRHLLQLMAELGIRAADIGMPAAGARMLAQVRLLAREIITSRLPISPSCAARTVVADIEPVVRVSQETGCAIEVATFVGSSDLRHSVEGWSLGDLIEATERSVGYAIRNGLPVMFVAEDATRARPETLRSLFTTAIAAGARRICLADTTGHATPAGVGAVVGFVRDEIIPATGQPVGLDWHGHRDRGLALANSLAAIEAGADRIHATALGIGERAGNTEMDLLLVNLYLLGAHRHDLSRLPDYCALAARATGVSLPANYPLVGRDAFRTGSGIHAAAILKARRDGPPDLADLVYSSVPAGAFGLGQQISVSPHSGLSNVRHWLGEHGYNPDDALAAEAILTAAKGSVRTLTDLECHRLATSVGARSASGAADVRH
jgi:2-isopropylmalate synthase